jgi:hypothetical protein
LINKLSHERSDEDENENEDEDEDEEENKNNNNQNMNIENEEFKQFLNLKNELEFSLEELLKNYRKGYHCKLELNLDFKTTSFNKF